jgi:hypothetical protein
LLGQEDFFSERARAGHAKSWLTVDPEVGHRAGRVHDLFAEKGPPVQAVLTLPAGGHPYHDHVVADSEVGHARADLDDLAGTLVPEYARHA